MNALGESLSLVECTGGDAADAECERAEYCVTRVLWTKLRSEIEKVLSATTLEKLCSEMRNLRKIGTSGSSVRVL